MAIMLRRNLNLLRKLTKKHMKGWLKKWLGLRGQELKRRKSCSSRQSSVKRPKTETK